MEKFWPNESSMPWITQRLLCRGEKGFLFYEFIATEHYAAC